MAISILSNNKIFKDKKSLSIVFKDLSDSLDFELKEEGDFALIFSNNKIVGINIDNYQRYFSVEEGFHSLNDEIIEFLAKKFSNYLKEEDFDDFFKIGQVKEINNHPSSSKLKVLSILFGDNQTKQIITNLEGIEKDRNYLFALPGAITFSGTRILKSKILNVESNGMILSYKSIGINKEGLVDCVNLKIEDKYKF